MFKMLKRNKLSTLELNLKHRHNMLCLVHFINNNVVHITIGCTYMSTPYLHTIYHNTAMTHLHK